MHKKGKELIICTHKKRNVGSISNFALPYFSKKECKIHLKCILKLNDIWFQIPEKDIEKKIQFYY